jgi:hypothetical protein
MTKKEVYDKIINTATHCEHTSDMVTYITPEEYNLIRPEPYMPSEPEPPKFNAGGGGAGLFSVTSDTYVYDFNCPHYRKARDNYHAAMKVYSERLIDSIMGENIFFMGPKGRIRIEVKNERKTNTR